MAHQLNFTLAIVENEQGKPAVNARELHFYLGSKQDFSNWFNNRVQTYSFVLNEDFLLNKLIEQTGSGGHNRSDYLVSIDMAKELCMLERNERGRQARRYFIAMEQKATRTAINQEKLVQLVERACPDIPLIKRYLALGLTMVEIGRLFKRHPDTIRRWLHKLNALGLTDWQPNQRYVALAYRSNTKQLALKLGGNHSPKGGKP